MIPRVRTPIAKTKKKVWPLFYSLIYRTPVKMKYRQQDNHAGSAHPLKHSATQASASVVYMNVRVPCPLVARN